jgi:hypothetical protein
MHDLLEKIAGFTMVLLLPIVVVGGALATLFAIGALFDALDHPDEVRGRIEAAFRRPPKAPRLAGPGHYYRPYWSGSSEG